MAKKPTLTDVTTAFNSGVAINANNDRIETSFENTISRDGSSPNQMEADFDLNNNSLLNVDQSDITTLRVGSLLINGVSVSPVSVAVSPTAEDTVITDAGNFYSSLNIEGALQELGNLTSITATPAEINTLDGITVSVGELNHLSGASSNIQNQLNLKQPQDATLTGLAGQTITAAGLALLDDVDAAAQRATLGVSTVPLQDQATWNTGTSTTESTITPAKLDAKVKDKLNAIGSAPLFGCRAWGSFDGTAVTVTLAAGGNVSSITDLGIGHYRITFSTAMPDANYSVMGSCLEVNTNSTAIVFSVDNVLAESFEIRVISTSTGAVDNDSISFAVFR